MLVHNRKTIKRHHYLKLTVKCIKIFKTILKEGEIIKETIRSKKPLAQSCSYCLIKKRRE